MHRVRTIDHISTGCVVVAIAVRSSGSVKEVYTKAVRGRWTGYRLRGNRLTANRKRPRGTPQRTRAHERSLHFFLAPDHERKSTSKNRDRVMGETRSPTIFFFFFIVHYLLRVIIIIYCFFFNMPLYIFVTYFLSLSFLQQS